MLPHAEIGQNDHREGTPHFIFAWLKMVIFTQKPDHSAAYTVKIARIKLKEFETINFGKKCPNISLKLL